MSLGGFKSVMWPTTFCSKLVYGDERTITAVGSQADYVYRANSVFDPDLTGVGGQPQGYDQLVALYNRYRVMAVEVEAEAFANAAAGNGGILVLAPSNSSSSYSSAEEVAGLRYAKSAMFTATTPAKVRALWHIGQLLGYSDESMLANTNVEAGVGTNPSFQQYVHAAVETAGSATNATVIYIKLTYYTRWEIPIQIIDSVPFRRARARLAVESAPRATAASSPSPACGRVKVTVK